MSSETAGPELSTPTTENVTVRAEGLGKAYLIFAKPQDRLKQMIFRRRRFFNEYWAFQNIDLEIRRGETIGIIGRNGSGKSTLLQVIAGTLQPTAGTLSVSGRVAPLLELGAGFNPEFTGVENVRLAASILGLGHAEIEERFERILDFAGLGDFVHQPVKTYSSGMYARLAFAVAAHVDADLLIVDEILSVGDAAFVQKCMRFIRAFKERGTLLFVSHETAAVNDLCDRAIWMDRGQIRAEGPAKDVSFAYQAALLGADDGGSFSVGGRRRAASVARRDLRHEAIAASDKRNVLEVFEFDPSAPSFGSGGGTILKVQFVASDGSATPVVEGGEKITLEICCRANRSLAGPIVGFLVRDRRGQNLFGDNTYLTYAKGPLVIAAGSTFTAKFMFQLPYLPAGDYSVAAALAEGTQETHVQHHWLDEALIFRCEHSPIAHGLLGIPMDAISLAADAVTSEPGNVAAE